MILGNAAALLAAALWAVASILFSREGERTRASVMNLVKSCFAIPLFGLAWLAIPPAVFPAGNAARMGVEPAILWLLVSGFVGIGLGDTFYFISLARIGVRRTMTLGLLAPIFAAGGAVLLGQPLPGLIGAGGIAVTLAGVFLVVRVSPVAGPGPGPASGEGGSDSQPMRGSGAELRGPGSRTSSMAAPRLYGAALFGLLSAFCQGVGIVLAKDAISAVGVIPASMLRLGAGVAGLLVLTLARPGRERLPSQIVRGLRQGRLLLAAFLGTFVAFFFFQLAIQLGSPPVTAALVGTSPLFAAPLAARYLHERMPILAAVGTVVAVAGVALVVLD